VGGIEPCVTVVTDVSTRTYHVVPMVSDFIRRINARTDRKLRRLGLMPETISRKRGLRDEQWKETEKRIRALLRSAKRREARIAASKSTIPLRNTEIDQRLKRRSDLLDRR